MLTDVGIIRIFAGLRMRVKMKTMKIIIFIGLALLLASCKQEQKPEPVPEELTKLERLYRIRPDSVMKHYDLSNDSLTEFPDLSRYVISSLDLSHNLLDTIIRYRSSPIETFFNEL